MRANITITITMTSMLRKTTVIIVKIIIIIEITKIILLLLLIADSGCIGVIDELNVFCCIIQSILNDDTSIQSNKFHIKMI